MTYPHITVMFACLFIITGLMSMDLYNPALPAITHALNAPQALIRNLVIGYLVGISISQLIYGPLSDRYGRKPIIMFGLLLCMLGNILSAMAAHGVFLLFSRFIAGLGAGACPVIGRLILRDCFHEKTKLTQAFSIFAMSSTLSPAFSPMIGGVLQTHFYWQATFIFLAVTLLIMSVLTLLFFKETLEKHPSGPIRIFKGYKDVLSNVQFIRYSATSALIFTISVGYYTISPFIFQNDLGFSAKANGMFYILYAFGVFLGSFSTNKMASYYKPETLLWLGVLLALSISLFMVFINLCGYFNVFTILVPVFILAFSCGITVPISISLGIHLFAKQTGVASALQGTIKMFGPLVLIVFSGIHFKEQLPMSIFFLIIIAVVTAINIFCSKGSRC